MALSRRDFLKAMGTGFGAALALEVADLPFVAQAAEAHPAVQQSYLNIFKRWLRTGELYPGLRYRLNGDNPELAHVLVPQEFRDSVNRHMMADSVMASHLRWLHPPETAERARIPEDGPLYRPARAGLEIPMHPLVFNITVSHSVVGDSDFPLLEELENRVGDAGAAVIDEVSIYGDGQGKPRGMWHTAQEHPFIERMQYGWRQHLYAHPKTLYDLRSRFQPLLSEGYYFNANPFMEPGHVLTGDFEDYAMAFSPAFYVQRLELGESFDEPGASGTKGDVLFRVIGKLGGALIYPERVRKEIVT